VINQLWGPVWDLVGDGSFKAFSHAWLFIKAANLVEVVLVVVLFVGGMFVHLPGGRVKADAQGSDSS
jgi:hypothetical protein